MRSILFILLSFLFFTTQTIAQVQHAGCLATFNTIKLNDKWSVHFDSQLRSTDELENLQSFLIRPGINYKVTKKVTLSGGFAYIFNRRTVNTVTGYVPEKLLWQQLSYAYKLNRVFVNNRFRFEERSLPIATVDNNNLKVYSHNSNFRFRYLFRNLIPLKKEIVFSKGPYVAVQNEIFVNTGKKSNVNGKIFDQNRAYGGVGFRVSNKFDIEAGYMNQYASTRTSFINNHTAQLAFYKRM